jgi:hypothetical protein
MSIRRDGGSQGDRANWPCLYNNGTLLPSSLKFSALNEVFLVSKGRRRCSVLLHLNPRSVTEYSSVVVFLQIKLFKFTI